MNCFQICQLVIICIHAQTKEEPGITSVDNLVVAKLNSGLNILSIDTFQKARTSTKFDWYF